MQRSKLHETFVEKQVLGSGNSGKVVRVTHLVDSMDYAVKIVSLEGARQRVEQEVHALARLTASPHLLRYYGAWEEDGSGYIVTELCDGSVRQLSRSGISDCEFLPEKLLCTILTHCLRALVELHDADVPYAHLDIKPHNILFKVLNPAEAGASQELQFKLGDLGSVVRANPTPRSVDEGDSRYMPLELLNSVPDEPQLLQSCDIFSLGATVYELARGVALPLGGPEWRSIRLEKLPALSNYSPELHALLDTMMHVDPQQRQTASALLQHPLLRSEKDSALAVEKAVVQHLSQRATEAYTQLAALRRCYESLMDQLAQAAQTPGPPTPPSDILRRHEQTLNSMGMAALSPLSSIAAAPVGRTLSGEAGYSGSARCAPASGSASAAASPARQLLYSPGSAQHTSADALPTSCSSAVPPSAAGGGAESKAAPASPKLPSPRGAREHSLGMPSFGSALPLPMVGGLPPGSRASSPVVAPTAGRAGSRARAPYTPARAGAPPTVQQPMPSPHTSEGPLSPGAAPALGDGRGVSPPQLVAPAAVYGSPAHTNAEHGGAQGPLSVMDDHMTVSNSTLMDTLTPYRAEGAAVKRGRPRGMSLSQGDLEGPTMLREGSGQSVAHSDAHSERSVRTAGPAAGGGVGNRGAGGGVGATESASVASQQGGTTEAFGWRDLRTDAPTAATGAPFLREVRGRLDLRRPAPIDVDSSSRGGGGVLLQQHMGRLAVVLPHHDEPSAPNSSRSSVDAPPLKPQAVRSDTWQGSTAGSACGPVGVQLPLRSTAGSGSSTPQAGQLGQVSAQRSLTSDAARSGEFGGGAFRCHSNEVALECSMGQRDASRGVLSALSPLAGSISNVDFGSTPRARKRPLEDDGADAASVASSAVHVVDGMPLHDSRVGSASLAASVCGDIGGAVDVSGYPSDGEDEDVDASSLTLSGARDAVGVSTGGCGSSNPSAPNTPSRPPLSRPSKIVRRGGVESFGQLPLQPPSITALQHNNRRRSSSSGANTGPAAARAAVAVVAAHRGDAGDGDWLVRTVRGLSSSSGFAAQRAAAAKLSPNRDVARGGASHGGPAGALRDGSLESRPAFDGTEGLRTTSAQSLESASNSMEGGGAGAAQRVDSLPLHPVTMPGRGGMQSMRQNSNDSPDINLEIYRSRGTGVRGGPTVFAADSAESLGGTGLGREAFSTPVHRRPGASPMDGTPPLLRASSPNEPLADAVLQRLQQVLQPSRAAVDVAGPVADAPPSTGQGGVSSALASLNSTPVHGRSSAVTSAAATPPLSQAVAMSGAEAHAAASRASMLLRQAQQKAELDVNQMRATASARKAEATPPRPPSGRNLVAVRCGSL